VYVGPSVTVHPSTTVGGLGLALVGRGEVRDGDGDIEGDADGDGGGGGETETGGSLSGADARSGVAVRSTGWSATVARPMLASVAAHHPSTGTQPRSRMQAIEPSALMVSRMSGSREATDLDHDGGRAPSGGAG
jgi:hypothetical protein